MSSPTPRFASLSTPCLESSWPPGLRAARVQPRSWRRSVLGCSFFLASLSLGVPLIVGQETSPEKEHDPAPVLADTDDSQLVQYNRDIRPILAENCFACHGPDSAARQADLRLDQREPAVDLMAIVPGAASESEMIARLFKAADDPLLMPPPESHKTLSDSQKQLLQRWIDQGAVYQAHWAFLAPQKAPLPEVGVSDWQANPIDRFVLQKLNELGLKPAAPADRYALVRRLSLDITGLPPSTDTIDRFVNDSSPDAYEQLIDRLLDSPRWGEHRARYWLDVARYADTHGIHFDNYREMWSYRDWVIQAFNRNQPFDEFTIEQLAGDLLPDPSLDQQVATGFNRCNITTNEGGIIDEEYAVLYARDRTETTAQTWLGLTVGCAVCHDHKFDPFSQQEFYELSAFFNNTTQGVRDGNIKDTPPTVFVPAKADQQRWQALSEEIPAAQQAQQAHKQTIAQTFEDWLRQPAAAEQWIAHGADLEQDLELLLPTAAALLSVPARLGDGAIEITVAPPTNEHADPDFPSALSPENGNIEVSGAGDFAGDAAFSFGAWVRFSGGSNSGAIFAKMANGGDYRGWDLWAEGGRIGTHLIHRWPEQALKVMTRDPIPSDQWVHLFVIYDGSQKAAGVSIYVNGSPVSVAIANDRLSGSIANSLPLRLFARTGNDPISQLKVDQVRLYRRQLTPVEVGDMAAEHRLLAVAKRIQDWREQASQPLADEDREFALERYLQKVDQRYPKLSQSLTTLEAEQNEIRQRGTLAHVMHERQEAAIAYVLNRGEYDQRRDQVSASTPAMLPPMDPGLPKNRLGLAQWLLAPEHPLTARVTVNQFWQSVFGQGLVDSSGDFGLTGTLPSHPELLDWLAVDFREHDWDIKRAFKQIFMSQTYRQSSVADPEKLRLDPDNRFFSRGPRFRMDAEMLRDAALASTGVLVPTIGGPSVKPYQPPGVWEAVAMLESDTRNYRQDTGDQLYRRSLYTFWKRSAPPASMDIFNAPSREVCTVRRERTNTPLQALVTLNDPQFIEAARVLATEVVDGSERSNSGGALQGLSLRILGRTLRDPELQILEKSYRRLHEFYTAHPDEAQQLTAIGETAVPEGIDRISVAAWTMVINQLLNLDEALTK